ncbi:uncharacterized protein LOC126866831 [Bombus huntii]|uniref:uncharacterized protein LOC126866831 n=1 Tax=Bombus huntii TaxID=85661 RepID=UPI0021A9B51E|nr:uncharacterized protein LOC126866831 [Bombus huntii]
MMWTKVCHSFSVGYDDKVVMCPKESKARGGYLMVEMRLMSHSHRYFSNANRSSGGLENDLSFRLSATLKPLAVVEYNEGKCGIDYSDQMVSYATTIRKGIKWYRKLGIRFFLGISVVNASTVYKIATRKNINIRIFRQLLVAKLLGLSENTKSPCLRRSRHNIAVRKNDSGRSIRRACKLCYANKRRRMDRTKAQRNLKKTTTYCPNCPDQPQLCIECFKVLHSK